MSIAFDVLMHNKTHEFCNAWVKHSLSDVLDVIQRQDWKDRMQMLVQQWQSEKVGATFEQYAEQAWTEYNS